MSVSPCYAFTVFKFSAHRDSDLFSCTALPEPFLPQLIAVLIPLRHLSSPSPWRVSVIVEPGVGLRLPTCGGAIRPSGTQIWVLTRATWHVVPGHSLYRPGEGGSPVLVCAAGGPGGQARSLSNLKAWAHEGERAGLGPLKAERTPDVSPPAAEVLSSWKPGGHCDAHFATYFSLLHRCGRRHRITGVDHYCRDVVEIIAMVAALLGWGVARTADGFRSSLINHPCSDR